MVSGWLLTDWTGLWKKNIQEIIEHEKKDQ
jgi:hypothetical protein